MSGPGFPREGELDPGRMPRLAGWIADQLASRQCLGGQVRIERDGEVVADAAFGEARPGEPMTRRHRMLWLSSTKPAAAIAVVGLWERGLLELDDPVARHIPEFAAGGKEGVTVRHLLTHTGGIRMLDTGWPEASWDEILARVCARRLEPRWVPGRNAGYHTTSSWFVLGELVRRLDGRPFERWVREALFEPLGETGCWIGMPEERFVGEAPLLAPMYEVTGAGLRDLELDAAPRVVRCSPGGNGWGPIAGLAALYRMLAGRGAAAGHRFLSPQAVEAMVARHRVGRVDQTFRKRLDWGLGVILDSKHYGESDVPYGYGPHAGPRTYGHSGARSSTAFVDPDAGLIVALAVNGQIDDAAHQVRFDAAARAIYEDLGAAPAVVE